MCVGGCCIGATYEGEMKKRGKYNKHRWQNGGGRMMVFQYDPRPFFLLLSRVFPCFCGPKCTLRVDTMSHF